MENSERKHSENATAPTPAGGDVQLAFVYAPSQAFRMMTAPAEALMRGTLFDELYKPLAETGGGNK